MYSYLGDDTANTLVQTNSTAAMIGDSTYAYMEIDVRLRTKKIPMNSSSEGKCKLQVNMTVSEGIIELNRVSNVNNGKPFVTFECLNASQTDTSLNEVENNHATVISEYGNNSTMCNFARKAQLGIVSQTAMMTIEEAFANVTGLETIPTEYSTIYIVKGGSEETKIDIDVVYACSGIETIESTVMATSEHEKFSDEGFFTSELENESQVAYSFGINT
eukprot:Nk52_evm67s151 gene=Nk52_evmTU67s151